MRSYRFHPKAAQEAAAAADYYDDKRSGLGSEFLQDLDDCVTAAREFPESGGPYGNTIRRRLFQRFPFSLVYDPKPEEIVIVAVAHDRRQPGYWRQRA